MFLWVRRIPSFQYLHFLKYFKEEKAKWLCTNKKILVSSISVVLCLSFLSSSAKANRTKDVVNDCYDLIELANQMFEENMHLSSFPFTNNGKVDKKALPFPEARSSAKGNKRLSKNDL